MTRRKSSKIVMPVFVSALALLAVLSITNKVWRSKEVRKLTPEIKARLKQDIIKDNLAMFLQQEGRLPHDLSELKRTIEDDSDQAYIKLSSWREYVSSAEGNDRESAVFDGKGGWYYNSESGEIRLNVCQ